MRASTAIATLAFGFIVEEVLARWESVTGGNAGMPVQPPALAGVSVAGPAGFYYLALAVCVLVTLGLLNLLRSPTGRAFIAVRDSEISAQSMGIQLARYKTLAFALSAAIVGIAGGLYAHLLNFISPEQFGIGQSIDLLLLVVVGGLGSVHGAFFGALFLIMMPQGIALARIGCRRRSAGQRPAGGGLRRGADGLRAVRADGPVRALAQDPHLQSCSPSTAGACSGARRPSRNPSGCAEGGRR